jgi:hypothetical protein
MNEKRNEQIDDFILFLNKHKFNSNNVNTYIRRLRIKNLMKMFLGLFFLLFALILIIIPLPYNLEIATLYYFSNEDGITVSDIFAIFLLLFGLILMLKDKIYYKSII